MPKKRVQRMASNDDQKENKFFKSRKRKSTSHSLEESITRTWHIGSAHSMQEIPGFLSRHSLDGCSVLPETTPAILGFSENSHSSSESFHLPPVPGAPRILLPSQCENVTSASEESSSLDQLSTPVPKTVLLLPQQTGFKRDNLVTSPCSKKPDPFNSLSDEIILCIFAWLPKFVLAKCARVCRRWSLLVLDESLWRRLELSGKTLGPGVLGHALNRGVWALRLCKTEIEGPIFTGPTSPMKSTRLCKVQYLDLSMAGVSTEVLEEIFSICRDLRKVSLEALTVNDKICHYIGKNRNLEVLNLAMCQGITASGLIPVLSHCKRLEALHIGWTHLHHHSIVYLCLCLPPSLLNLNLSGCRENITDEEVLQLCSTCPNLLELDLSDATMLTGASISHITSHLKQLQYLALSRCYQLLPSAIPELTELDSLLALDVFGLLRDGPLEVLKSNMPRVEVNQFPFSCIARPTTGIRRTSIWGIRVRDNAV